MTNGKYIDFKRIETETNVMDIAKELGLETRGTKARCFNSQSHSHNDNNFSLSFDLTKNRFRCFTCGKGGDVFDLYSKIKGISLSQATKDLARRLGAYTDLWQSSKPQNSPYTQKKHVIGEKTQTHKKNSLQALTKPNTAYSNIYEEFVFACGELNEENKAYLTGKTRGLTEETIKKFSLCSINNYGEINKHLKKMFGVEKLREAGLINQEKENLMFYEHKMITPIMEDNKIVFLNARKLNEDSNSPKYLNIRRPMPLFNQDKLKELNKGDKVYICEGLFDTMIMEQNGYNAVGILGANGFKAEFINLFKDFDVFLAFDNDFAGENRAKELEKTFLEKGQLAKIKKLPNGIKDITEYFLKDEEIKRVLGILQGMENKGIYIDGELKKPSIELKKATNRIYYASPSLSQIGEWKKTKPNILKPNKDYELIAFDFKQEEPIILCHFLKEKGLYKYKGGDIYFEVCGDMPRKEAKTIVNTAINGGKIEIENDFFKAIQEYKTSLLRDYEQNGYIQTIAKRELAIEDTQNLAGKVVNRKIQGSASDLHIRALIKLNEYLKDMKSYVYLANIDELVIAFHDSEIKEKRNIEILLSNISKLFNLIYNIEVKSYCYYND